MEMDSEIFALAGIGVVLSLAARIGLIVVGVVARKASPRGGSLIALGGLIQVCAGCLSMAAPVVLFRYQSPESVAKSVAAVNLLSGVVTAAGVALVVGGIAVLASEKTRMVREG